MDARPVRLAELVGAMSLATDLANGFVLTCQAHPLTERVVLSFDER